MVGRKKLSIFIAVFICWGCSIAHAKRDKTSFPNLYDFGLRHVHDRHSYEADDEDDGGYETSTHGQSSNHTRYRAHEEDSQEEEEGGSESSYDISILTPPRFPWDNDFRSFAADNSNFEISAGYLENGIIPEVDGSDWNAVYDTLYVVDGTNDIATNSYRQRFINLAGQDHVCSITAVDPQLNDCVENWIHHRMNLWGISEDEARRSLRMVMGGHGYGGMGGRISLGGGNWTVHPNRNLGDQEGAMYNFLIDQLMRGNEYASIKILACDTGAGAADPNYAGVQKTLAMLPGNPQVKAYDGTVFTSLNGTSMSPGHREITVQLHPDLVGETSLADINPNFNTDLAVY